MTSRLSQPLFDAGLPIVPLCEMSDGLEADTFALLASKEELTTRTGKLYFRVVFRDAQREVSFPIWADSGWADACREQWSVGEYYKLRTLYRETAYGPQLDIRKIRPVTDDDRQSGFDESMCRPSTEFDPEGMHAALCRLARDEIRDQELSSLVAGILERHRTTLLALPAATRNHHAYVGGYLEHVLSVVRNAKLLCDKYQQDYPKLQQSLSRDIVMAGAILHDIGKLRELEQGPAGAAYTPAGVLVGHVLLGRDIVREEAAQHRVDEATLLHIEHIIVSHQRLPEWGSPKPPMTLEALIVHYADDLDAKLQIMMTALDEATGDGFMTSSKNALGQKLFRGNIKPGQ